MSHLCYILYVCALVMFASPLQEKHKSANVSKSLTAETHVSIARRLLCAGMVETKKIYCVYSAYIKRILHIPDYENITVWCH